jgi:acyl transferase domain-containing protein
VSETNYDSAVAIIGMSGRFPGAATVDEFWRNLVEGRPGLRTLTEEELTAAGVSPSLLANPAYVRVGAPVEGIDEFDAGMFGFSRREAETMDPQHRLFLECTWEALESAGYAPNQAPGKVGVFGGSGFPDYLFNVLPKVRNEPGGSLLVATGGERDSLCSMVSYKFDLRGPSVAVQTFCSSSLVAVHMAVQSLLAFESDMALAGGVYLQLPQHAGYLFEEGSITTPDGRVRSFDAAARGTVLGNGVAVVALKRMTEALADGDPIHAVILGSAVNNDGRACAGYTAPGMDGQAEVVELALAVADVKPETVGYLECHATGTQLGDSIELAALSRVFQRPPATPTVLSTLKPSVGHLDRASGVAGLIRTALALRHQVLPATPGFETPNPALAAAQDRFTVLTRPRQWEANHHPRRAGVSSFGFGGTNAHVVLEEAPAVPVEPPRPGPHLLVLSARDLNALYAAVEQLRRHLEQHPDQHLADVAHTLQQSRTSFMLRWAVVCRDHDDAVAALADPARWIIGEAQHTDAPVTLRIPDPILVPDAWWHDLRAAAVRMVPPGDPVPPRADTDGSAQLRAAQAVADALIRLGLRLAGVVGEGAGADAVATRLAAEFDLPAAPTDAVAEFALDPADDEPADERLRTLLALIWQAGADVDWRALHPGRPRRIPLPTYPFQRQRYWIEPTSLPGDGSRHR